MLQVHASRGYHNNQARNYTYFHSITPSNAAAFCDIWVLLEVKENILPDNMKLASHDHIILQDVALNPTNEGSLKPHLPTVFGHIGCIA